VVSLASIVLHQIHQRLLVYFVAALVLSHFHEWEFLPEVVLRVLHAVPVAGPDSVVLPVTETVGARHRGNERRPAGGGPRGRESAGGDARGRRGQHRGRGHGLFIHQRWILVGVTRRGRITAASDNQPIAIHPNHSSQKVKKYSAFESNEDNEAGPQIKIPSGFEGVF